MDLTNQTTFDKVFNTAVKVLPIPDLAEDAIIAAKDLLKNDEIKDKVKEIFNNTINKDGKIVGNISEIKDAIKQEGIKEGVSKTIDVVINNLKKSKTIDKNTANLLKDSKEYIIDNAINNEIEQRYKGQEKVLKNINKKYINWENEFNNLNIEKMERIHKSIQKDYQKLLPTTEILDKIKQIDNLTELAKNKIKNGENSITELEKEICRKAG